GLSTVSWWSRNCPVCLNVPPSRRGVAFILVSSPILSIRPNSPLASHFTPRSDLSKGVEQQAGEQLGEEVGRLRGHVLARRSDIPDLGHGCGTHQQGSIVLARADHRERLGGVA